MKTEVIKFSDFFVDSKKTSLLEVMKKDKQLKISKKDKQVNTGKEDKRVKITKKDKQNIGKEDKRLKISKKDKQKVNLEKVVKVAFKTSKYIIIGMTIAKSAGLLYHVFIPSQVGVKTVGVKAIKVMATATTSSSVGWDKVLKKSVEIADYLMRGLLVYNGILWMFGHRSNAVSGIIGSCVGYLIVRHHEAIRLFIQSL